MPNKTILFLGNIEQLNSIIFYQRHLLDKSCSICFDFIVGAELRRLGYNIVFLDEFIEDNDLKLAIETADDLVNIWYEPFFEDISCNGIYPAKIMSVDLRSAFIAAITTKIAMSRLLKDYRPNIFQAVTGPGVPFWGSEIYCPSDFHAGVALRMAETVGIITRIIRSIPLRHSADSSYNSIQNNQYSCNSKVANKILSSGNAKKRILAFLGVPQDYAEQRALADYLSNSESYHYIPVRIGHYYPMPIFKGHELAFQDFFILSQDTENLNLSLNNAWGRFKAYQKNYTGDFPELFANPYLDFQFKGFWNRLRDGLQYFVAAGILMDAINPQLVTFGTMHCGHQRIMVEAARIRNIPTLTLMHGGITTYLEYRNGFPNSGLYCVWGKADSKALNSHNLDMTRVRITGSLRHIEAFVKQKKNLKKNRSGAMQLLRENFNCGSNTKIIVILTGSINSGLFNYARLSIHSKIWDQLEGIAKRRPDYCFVIKPHPRYDYHHFYRSAVKNRWQHLKLLEDKSLDDILPVIDLAIIINTPTTAALEALVYNVPLLYLREGHIEIDAVQTHIDKGPWVINNLIELERSIDRVFTQDDFRQEIMKKGTELVKDFWGEHPDLALDNTINAVNECLKASTLQTFFEQDEKFTTNALCCSIKIRELLDNLVKERRIELSKSMSKLNLCDTKLTSHCLQIVGNYFSTLPNLISDYLYIVDSLKQSIIPNIVKSEIIASLSMHAFFRACESGNKKKALSFLLRIFLSKPKVILKDKRLFLKGILLFFFGSSGIVMLRSLIHYLKWGKYRFILHFMKQIKPNKD